MTRQMKQEVEMFPGTDLPAVNLSPVRSSDIGAIHQWIDDDKARCWLDMGGGRQTLSKIQLHTMLTSARTCARLIHYQDGGPVGLVCLNDADNLMGTADIWGVRGAYDGGPSNVAVAAFLAMLATGFLDLNREVIGSWVVEGNYLSLLMHQRLGMTEVGRPRGRHVIGTKRLDRILFDMTLAEFGEKFPDVPSESGQTYRQMMAKNQVA